MKLMTLGVDLSSGAPLIPPMEEDSLATAVARGLGDRAPALRTLCRNTNTCIAFRGEMQRRKTPDLGDPLSAGWTFLANEADPLLGEYIRVLRPLAERRGMADPSAPLLFAHQALSDWADWSLEQLERSAPAPAPKYILIVGDPEQVPFSFQSFLDSTAFVGRLALDTVDDLARYVEKVLRLEDAPAPAVARETLFFAPDGGFDDPTFYSRRNMAAPLADLVRKQHGIDVRSIEGDEASRKNLRAACALRSPALVFVAAHGIGGGDDDLQTRRRYNGAICCADSDGWSLGSAFCADDVPLDLPFLEGAAFFQFGCFGYGTPAQSDFLHWLGDAPVASGQSTVSALPKALLAHPRGPIAYVGHVDLAWLHAFTDPDAPGLRRLHNRLTPFVAAVDALLRLQPVAMAMEGMNSRYNQHNLLLTSLFDRMKRRGQAFSEEHWARLIDLFICRGDAQNYFVLGDPAAQLRIPT